MNGWWDGATEETLVKRGNVESLKSDATALLLAAREVLEVHGCGLPPGDCESCRDLRMAIWQAEGDEERGGIRIVERGR